MTVDLCDTPIDGGWMTLDGDDMGAIFEHMRSEGWASRFSEDLQSLRMDSAGENLLSTWLPLVEAQQFLAEIQPTLTVMRWRDRLDEWREKGATRVYVDGYPYSS